MTEREITERKLIARAYKQGRKELVQSVCDSLEEEFYNYDSKNDYYAGFDNGIKRAMRVMKAEAGDLDGREKNGAGRGNVREKAGGRV